MKDSKNSHNSEPWLHQGKIENLLSRIVALWFLCRLADKAVSGQLDRQALVTCLHRIFNLHDILISLRNELLTSLDFDSGLQWKIETYVCKV
jgi:hypothetical protein